MFSESNTFAKVQPLQMNQKVHDIGKEATQASYQRRIHEKRGGFNHI